MKEKVLELQQIFVNRIEAGEFDVLSVEKGDETAYFIDIKIDGFYFRIFYMIGIFKNIIVSVSKLSFMELTKINNPEFLTKAIENYESTL